MRGREESGVETAKGLRRRTRGLATLLEVSKSFAATLDMEEILQRAVEGAVSLVGLDTAAVYLVEGEMLRLWATTPTLPADFPEELRLAPLAEHPHMWGVLRSKRPLYLEDFRAVTETAAERLVCEQRGLRTTLFVPLIADDHVTGAFIVSSVGKIAPIEELEIDLCRTLANLAALTVRSARLFDESRRYAEELEQTLAEQRQSEQERRELEARLQRAERLQAIGRLAGGVAHDFNNMLSVIIGYTDLAMKDLGPADPRYPDLLEVRQAAERSASLARQLLAFARRQSAKPETLELNGVIGDMCRMLRRLIGEDVDLEWRPSREPAWVRIDPAQVDQILANLCINARDAISGVGKIVIETAQVVVDEAFCAEHHHVTPGAYVRLRVTDNGRGMDADTLSKVFEPYFSTKKEGEGTGLGLSTVYGIVMQNDGLIEVTSEVGRGTTVHIHFPAREAGHGNRAERESEASERGSETILLVEDEISILELCRRLLDSLGYRVLATTSPTAALETAAEHAEDIDLLITDIVMPEMNGRELSQRLEAIRPGVATLFVSGYTAEVIANRGVLQEGVLLLPKPFTEKQLAEKVREALEQRSRGRVAPRSAPPRNC